MRNMIAEAYRRTLARYAGTFEALAAAPEPIGPPGDGWSVYLYALPVRSRLIEMWRAEWGTETHFIRPRDMNPEFNVAGLYWRYADA